MTVLLAVVVLVAVLDPVVVFVPGSVIVCPGDDDEVLDDEEVFVEVIDDVIVFVDVGLRVTREVGNDERVAVVVFVDVFDMVGVDV